MNHRGGSLACFFRSNDIERSLTPLSPFWMRSSTGLWHGGRVAAMADAGEIMISSTTRDLVGSIEGTRMVEPAVVALKGLSNTHQIVAVK